MSTGSSIPEKEAFLQELNAIYTIIEGGGTSSDENGGELTNQLGVAQTNNSTVQSASTVAEAKPAFTQVNAAAQNVRDARNQIKTKVFGLREEYKHLTEKEERAARPDGTEVARRRAQAAAAAEEAAEAARAAAQLREQERQAEARREAEKQKAAEAAQRAREAQAAEEAAEREAAQAAADAARQAELSENAAAREKRQAQAADGDDEASAGSPGQEGTKGGA